MTKSLIVSEKGDRYGHLAGIVPRSTRNMPYASRERNIQDVNVSVIPPPTSIHQQDLINKRARKFSAKMSTAIGSERGNSRGGGGNGRYPG